MLRNGKELKNYTVEPQIIANDVLLFSQIFGGLPLKYIKHLNKKTTIAFSKTLQLFGFAYITCLTIWSCGGLYYDYSRYLAGHPLIMVDTLSVITEFADVFFLNSMAMVVILTANRKHDKFIEMCRELERVDKSVEEKSDRRTSSTWKVSTTFLFMTAVFTWTLGIRILRVPLIEMIYSHKIFMYYTQTAVFLLFSFVTNSLTTRFRNVNEKIQQEVVRLDLKLLINDLNLPNTISGEECSAADRVHVLIASYTRLYKVLQIANSFYQTQLFATVSVSFVQGTLSLYRFFIAVWSTRIVTGNSSLLLKALWALLHTSYLYLLIWPTKTLKQEAGKTAPLVCQILSKKINDDKLRDQLETFLLQLRHYKLEFTAHGFFQMNSDLLAVIASSITTYLVILIQLKLKEK